MSFISGIPIRLQYKPIINIIDSNKCICRNIKLQIKNTTKKSENDNNNIKSITNYSENDVCVVCRNKLSQLCIECQADSFVNNHTKNDCINIGSNNCMNRWLKTRDSCPSDNKIWKFICNKYVNF